MKHLIILLTCLFVFLSSCERNELPKDENTSIVNEGLPETEDYKVQWKYNMNQELDSLHNISHITKDDEHLYLASSFVLYNENDKLYKLNFETGECEWKIQLDTWGVKKIYTYKRILVFSAANKVYIVDKVNGDILWSYDFRINDGLCINPGHGFFENGYYISLGDCNNPNQALNKIVRLDLDDLSIEHLVQHDYNGTSVPFIGGITVKYDENGDEILYYPLSYQNGAIGGGFGYIIAYNRTTNEEKWRSIDYTNKPNIHVPPLLHEGMLIHHGGVTVACFDEISGEQIWSTDFPFDYENIFGQTPLYISGNKLVSTSYSGSVGSFDILDGTTKSMHIDHLGFIDNWVPHLENLISCTHAGIIKFNPIHGTFTVILDSSPIGPNYELKSNPILKDHESEDIIMTDRNHIFRIELKNL